MTQASETTLTNTDLANLSKRWIDPSLAEAAGIRRVNCDEGKRLVGRSGHDSYEGLQIPYFLPGESCPRECRLAASWSLLMAAEATLVAGTPEAISTARKQLRVAVNLARGR
jgi:hypothetical protein